MATLSFLLLLFAGLAALSQTAHITSRTELPIGALRKSKRDANLENEICWSRWVSYWNASATATSQYFSTRTFNRTDTATIPIRSSLSAFTTTYVTIVTATVTAGRSFVVSSETYLETQSLVYTETVYATSPSILTTTWLSRTVDESTYSKPLTTPPCALPSPYSACQSQWQAYLQNTGATSPACTQASINDQQCKSVIYAAGGAGMLAGETPLDFTTSDASSTWWPAKSSLAPGCTLGCQTCAITGSTVKVFYWPPSTASAWQNGTMTATVTQKPPSETEVMVAVVDNATLTSPTVYISYDVLYASDSCSGLGATYRNTIVPLSRSADLSSLVYVQYQGENNFIYTTQAFNYDDLQEPIPDSVYQQLPSCAREYQSFSISYFGGSNTTAFTCERRGAYSPIIAIPTEVRNLNPAWKDCTVWYGGLYDPPSALQAVPLAVTPTQPSVATSAPPEPLATITSPEPQQTGVSTIDPTRAVEHASQRPHSSASDRTHDSDPKATGIAGIIVSAINGGLEHARTTSTSDPEGGDQNDESPLTTVLSRTAALGGGNGEDPSRSSSHKASVVGNPGTTRLQSTASEDPVHHHTDSPSQPPPQPSPPNPPIESNHAGATSTLASNLVHQSTNNIPPYHHTANAQQGQHPTTSISSTLFTITDPQFGPQVYTAYPITGSGNETLLALCRATMTPGAPPIALNLWEVSLRADGALTTLPIDRGTPPATTSAVDATSNGLTAQGSGVSSSAVVVSSGSKRKGGGGRTQASWVGIALCGVVALVGVF